MAAVNDRRDTRPVAVRAGNALDTEASWQHRYARLLLLLDLCGVVSAVGLAQWLRFAGPFGFPNQPNQMHQSAVSAFIALCWILVLTINHSRSARVIGSGAEEYRRVWVGTLTTFGGIAILSMLLELNIARGYLLIALPVGAVLLLALRWTARRQLSHARQRHGRFITRVLAVGSAPAVRELTECLARDPRGGYRVVGACIPDSVADSVLEVGSAGDVRVFGDETNVVEAVSATGSHAVAVTATDRLRGRGLRDLSWELEKLDVELLVAPGVVDVAGPRLQMRPVAGLPLIHVDKPQYHGAQRMQKRFFDLAFSGAVLLLGLPVYACLAVAVKLTSRGPALYRQERIGRNGKVFEILKFRTMVDGAESMVLELVDSDLVASAQCPFKFVNDPRVTPLGGFLRKYSLDELPQFINVLKGDMSVVGPRPQVAKEVQNYDDRTRRRLLVRPGITGLWQISGRSDLSWEDSVRLDLFYVENWSMMADLVIAVKTARAVFGRQGAY
jgi:exopolysaccharide biosynthesis polyprenyl glycosylphosphotransferase